MSISSAGQVCSGAFRGLLDTQTPFNVALVANVVNLVGAGPSF